MTKYREFKGLNLPDIDNEILAFGQITKFSKKSISSRPEDKTFVFMRVPLRQWHARHPPRDVANGKRPILSLPNHEGQTRRTQGGWDTHGLPIELSVEKNWASPKKTSAPKSQLTNTTPSAVKP